MQSICYYQFMNIKLNKEDLEKFIHLEKVKENNIFIAELFNNLCLYLEDELKETFLDNNTPINYENILQALEIDYGEELKPYFTSAFQIEDVDKYLNNPYYQTFKNHHITSHGRVKLSLLNYPSFSLFPLDEIKVDDNNYYREYSYLGLFKQEYHYLALIDNNDIWMCITPNEINTMQPYIDKAKGKVITFGLGLGYFPFMALNKKDVEEIYIVEKDERIIDIFSKFLKDKFPRKEAIHIIKDDALKYIDNHDLSKYDFIYYDLWHNPNDGLPIYLKLKNKEKVPSYYWLETSLLALLRRYLISLIDEQLSGSTPSDYIDDSNIDNQIINTLYDVSKQMNISSYQDIDNLLKDESLLSLIKKMQLRHLN